MQARENWADIRGTVRSWNPTSEAPDHGAAEIAVEAAEDVPGFRNMLAASVGKTITVLVPTASQDAAGVRPGDRFAARVRLVAPGRAVAR